MYVYIIGCVDLLYVCVYNGLCWSFVTQLHTCICRITVGRFYECIKNIALL